jgi:coenzyme PQQ precursor peptide PqqA
LQGSSRRTIIGCCLWRRNEETWRKIMAWTTPSLVEICIGLEINGYLPAEF